MDAGHEDEGISRNADWDTPLMLAAEAHPEVAELLAERFERCVTWTNKRGVDAVRVALHNLLQAPISNHASTPFITHITNPPFLSPIAHARLPRRLHTHRHDTPLTQRVRDRRRQRRQHSAPLRLRLRPTESHPHAPLRRRVAAGPQRLLVDAHRLFQHRGGRSVFQEPGGRVREAEGAECAGGEGEEGVWWRALGYGRGGVGVAWGRECELGGE